MASDPTHREEVQSKKTGGLRWWFIFGSGVVICLLLACSGAAFVVYRGLNVIVETYELNSQPTIDGVLVDVEIRPQTRTKDSFGDQLVGPPYELMFHLRDPSGRITRARLHQVRVVPQGAGEFLAPVTNGDNLAQQGFVLLYARDQQQPLGRSVRLYADIEVFRNNGWPAREVIELSLTRSSRASLNIP